MTFSAQHRFNGQWIQNPKFASLQPIDLFHKEHVGKAIPAVPEETLNNHTWFIGRFTVPEQTKILKIDISADDYARVYLNGKLLGLGPAQAYAEDYQYNSYLIRENIRPGENILAVHVFYQGLRNRAYQSGDNREGMIADIFADNRLIACSDESFLYREAPEYVAGPRLGYDTAFLENLDMTKSHGASTIGEGEGWAPVFVRSDADYAFRELPDQGLNIFEQFPVLLSHVQGDSQTIFMDFGEEIVGAVRLKAFGSRGSVIRLLCGEELDEHDAEMPRYRMRCYCNYEEFLTLSGNPSGDDFVFFDSKGFRYARVELPEGCTLDPIGPFAEVRRRRNATPRIRFQTDDQELASILKLCERTIINGISEVFPDCPQREKGQYVGDFTISGLAYLYLTGDWASYKKAIRDFADSAKICPGLMAVAPGALMQEIADYSLQFPLQIWNGYRYSKDRSFLRENLPIIEGILEHFSRFERPDGLLNGVTDKWNLVDWPANLRDNYAVPLPKPVPPDCIHNVINAFWIGAHIVKNRIQAELGMEKTSDIDRMVESFDALFYDEEKRLYRDGPGYDHFAIHSNVLPVFFGFAHPDSIESIRALLNERTLSCGMYFSYFLFGACAALHDYDLIYKILKERDHKGWLYMLSQGASTLFEAWGKEQKANTSLCHPFGAAPIITVYEALAPHRPDIVTVNPIK